jgi:hypothetical protein
MSLNTSGLGRDYDIIIIVIQVYCPTESENYERHSETITIPPAHIALHCDNRLPIWGQQTADKG